MTISEPAVKRTIGVGILHTCQAMLQHAAEQSKDPRLKRLLVERIYEAVRVKPWVPDPTEHLASVFDVLRGSCADQDDLVVAIIAACQSMGLEARVLLLGDEPDRWISCAAEVKIGEEWVRMEPPAPFGEKAKEWALTHTMTRTSVGSP